eukprot:CAMPEP_0170484832 /NCGR_PEP_ID=MMETSP0208-20121228/4210_1 /TAXON_ID=197538 /ORGANISM="Strombidium inclinatum, Strain S3" /LENGTH=165 /DNA_ID=CAMNT_0010758275 /DNA_START=540 /DNA_END=1037 /DNA_ORIENTATION=+
MKFTPQGKITILASPVMREGHWFLRVQVRDTGCGIKKEDHSKLFNLFGTLDRTSQQNTQGIGLGLAICQKIVHEFGGEITFKSSFGQGTKFTFEFKLTHYDGNSSNMRGRPVSRGASLNSFSFKSEQREERKDELATAVLPEANNLEVFDTSMESVFPRILVVDD